MTDVYFKNDAKQIVDMLFDTKVFSETLERDNFNQVQEYLELCLQQKFNGYIRTKELMESISAKILK